jgi:hypothetical protein
MENNDETQLQTVNAAPMVRPMSPAAVCDALTQYREIQTALDSAFPDCIMHVQGKQFRKKSYWRAVSTAFRLSVEIVSDAEYVDENGGRHWLATAKATAPDGRSATGDGSCSASEKTDRQGRPTKMATLHNIRAHACTRAKNRAISDLVGFGEVSAEELGAGAYNDRQPPKPRTIDVAPSEYREAGPPRDSPRDYDAPPAPSSAPSSARRDLKCPQCNSKLYDHIADRRAGTTDYPAIGCSNRGCDLVFWSATEAEDLIRKMDAGELFPTDSNSAHFDDDASAR